MDGNRAEDGVNLRYRFGAEKNIPEAEIAYHLDSRPCSMLEMMCALALRCEETIMSDPDEGDRTGIWFWNMIKSLGLTKMTDGELNISDRVERATDAVTYHTYAANGSGGLFTIRGEHNMRNYEIWMQMMLYLDSIVK